MPDPSSAVPGVPELPTLSIHNIGGEGAAAEMIGHEIDRVLENILDVNTKPDATREIVLSIKFSPSKERDAGTVVLQAKSKLAPPEGMGSPIFIGTRRGKPVATTYNPAQAQFQWDQEDKPRVLGRTGTDGQQAEKSE